MHYVSTCNIRVVCNDELTNKIFPMKSICHGDPLSPNLFILCIERLVQCVELAISNNSWKPFKLVKNEIPISHLFFLLTTLCFFLKQLRTKLLCCICALKTFGYVQERKLMQINPKCSFP